jgi:uncharacterized membrane protein
MNPFDPHTVIFAKHAQHVVVIHFPIALFIGGVAFDLIAICMRRKNLALVAYCNFSGALLTAIPAVLTGLLAWQWELEGRKLKGILLMHLVAGCTSLVLIAMVWWLHWRSNRSTDAKLPALRWVLELLGGGSSDDNRASRGIP